MSRLTNVHAMAIVIAAHRMPQSCELESFAKRSRCCVCSHSMPGKVMGSTMKKPCNGTTHRHCRHQRSPSLESCRPECFSGKPELFLTIDSYENTSSYHSLRQLCLRLLLTHHVDENRVRLQQMRLRKVRLWQMQVLQVRCLRLRCLQVRERIALSDADLHRVVLPSDAVFLGIAACAASTHLRLMRVPSRLIRLQQPLQRCLPGLRQFENFF